MIKRPPDLIIGDNYLHRSYVIPRNKLLNVYLHQFHGNDDDRALHDHPWYSLSFLLKGEVKEHGLNRKRLIPWLLPVFRSAKFSHRLELVKGPATTLFITGPVIRHWGFHCPSGWIPWEQFTDQSGGQIGAGCGEKLKAKYESEKTTARPSETPSRVRRRDMQSANKRGTTRVTG